MELIEREAAIKLLMSLGSREHRREKGTICEAIKIISSPEYTPTIDPIRAAGGWWCGECQHSSYDAEYNKRWCNHGSGCREVKTDGSGFCDFGVQKEAQDDG